MSAVSLRDVASSPVRDLLALIDRPEVISFAGGLPAPELQREIVGAFVDFAWPAFRTVGEFDGRVKYGKYLRPGQDPADAVVAEKIREDRIRDEGWRVVRWVWADLEDFRVVAHRLRRAFTAPR